MCGRTISKRKMNNIIKQKGKSTINTVKKFRSLLKASKEKALVT